MLLGECRGCCRPRLYLADLDDPRRETENKLHPLQTIVFIVLCAVLSGVEDWVGMEEFAHEKKSWLRTFVDPPQRDSSHDTLSDVWVASIPAKNGPS